MNFSKFGKFSATATVIYKVVKMQLFKRPSGLDFDQGEMLAMALLAWPSCLLLSIAVSFLAKVSIGPWHVYLSALLASGLCWLVLMRPTRRIPVSTFLAIVGLAALLTAISFWLAGLMHDFSSDGQNYHQLGILHLMGGWNPIWSPMEESISRLVINYPKASWKVSAALAASFGSVELGKGLCFILAIAAGLVLRGFLERLGLAASWRRTLLVLVGAAPPVLVSQFGTYYLDSLLFACLLILAVGLIDFFLWGPSQRMWLWGLANLILLDLKFTGPVYSVILTVICLIWLARTQRGNVKALLRAIVISGFLGVIVCGANPYITNLVNFGHPLYPANKENIIKNQAPPEFVAKGRVSKFLWSISSRSNGSPKLMPQLKFPFTFDNEEIRTLGTTSLRYGGFGPLFSGVLLLLPWAACLISRSTLRRFTVGLVLSAVVLGMTLMFPDPWYFRLVPQVWILPLIWITLLLMSSGRSARWLSSTMLVLLLVNQSMFLHTNIKNRRADEASFNRQIAAMVLAATDGPLQVIAPWPAFVHRLKSQGIEFVIVDELDCTKREHIIGGRGRAFWCPPQPGLPAP